MPNEYSKNIVYLSKAQYQELITNNSITVDGQTITYSDSDIYVTPQAEPVTDVQINSTSVVTNGVANIPISSQYNFGVVKNNGEYGVYTDNNGFLRTASASTEIVKAGTNSYRTIKPSNQHEAAFYGLAKAAGADMASSSNLVGTYTDAAKQKIQNMLGITDLLSTEETTTATAAHALNSIFLMSGKLYKATAAIAIGDAVVEGENCEVVKIEDIFIKNTDYASTTAAGVAKIGDGLVMDSDTLKVAGASSATVKTSSNSRYPIVPSRQHESVFYGLSKLAGVDLKNETVTVGTYPETSKTAIRSLIGAAAASDVTVSDVQVNGTSVLSDGVANIPIADSNIAGVIKADSYYGAYVNANGKLQINPSELAMIPAGTNAYRPIVPSTQHASTFYGLAKAAGDTTQAASSNAIGAYTETAKVAIRNMLGAASTNIVAVQDEQPTDTDTKVWLPESQATGVEVPTMADLDNYVQKTDIATASTAGVVKVSESTYGLRMRTDEQLGTYLASDANVKGGVEPYRPIVPYNQHVSSFYGLAKAAGDVTQSASDNAVGTYTTEAKSAIQSMLGIDLQSIASEVEIPLVETVSGTTPSITGQPNTRYVCGKVSTLSITPPSAGSIDVIFDSGSTPAVITVPNTVRWPAWFDATALEADTTYEILITDGVYGSVMTWAN